MPMATRKDNDNEEWSLALSASRLQISLTRAALGSKDEVLHEENLRE